MKKLTAKKWVCIVYKIWATHSFGTTEVEQDELDVAGGVGGEDESVKHQEHLTVQLLGGLPVTLTCQVNDTTYTLKYTQAVPLHKIWSTKQRLRQYILSSFTPCIWNYCDKLKHWYMLNSFYYLEIKTTS